MVKPGIAKKIQIGDKKWGKWKAAIVIGDKKVFLGGFDSQEEAHQAYLKAKGNLNQ